MSICHQSHRNLEETVEAVFKGMGYRTRLNNVLHTRPTHIHAEIDHPQGSQKLLIECKHCEGLVDVKDVEKFCYKVAFAREHSIANSGVLISKSDFSHEAVVWCSRNCSFVELKTYKQILHRQIRFKKMLKKFINSSSLFLVH